MTFIVKLYLNGLLLDVFSLEVIFQKDNVTVTNFRHVFSTPQIEIEIPASD